jgi:hypothetical protein
VTGRRWLTWDEIEAWAKARGRLDETAAAAERERIGLVADEEADACVSERQSPEHFRDAVTEWREDLGYDPITGEAL